MYNNSTFIWVWLKPNVKFPAPRKPWHVHKPFVFVWFRLVFLLAIILAPPILLCWQSSKYILYRFYLDGINRCVSDKKLTLNSEFCQHTKQDFTRNFGAKLRRGVLTKFQILSQFFNRNRLNKTVKIIIWIFGFIQCIYVNK